MFARLTAAASLAVALVLGTFSAALAETYSISLGDAAMLISIPDSWKVSEIKRGLQIVSPDKEVYLWAEAYTDSTFKALTAEHDKYYEEHNVKLGEPKIKKVEVNGMPAAIMDIPATYKGEKQVVGYLLINPGLKNTGQFMLSTWSSVEGDKKHDKATTAMIESLKLKK
jgi:hypothetical protein